MWVFLPLDVDLNNNHKIAIMFWFKMQKLVFCRAKNEIIDK